MFLVHLLCKYETTNLDLNKIDYYLFSHTLINPEIYTFLINTHLYFYLTLEILKTSRKFQNALNAF